MANPVSLPGDLVIPGNLRVAGSISPALARASILAQSELQPFLVPWTAWRVYDALHTNLPGTAATDDLALIGGAFGSASPSIQTLDFGGTSTAAYARAQVALPWEYEDGQTVTLRFHAGALTTVADSYLKLDVVCHETDEGAGIGADICATAEQSINSLVLADIDFTITPTGLTAGDLLDIRIKMSGEDAGDLGVMKGIIGAIKLLCDVR